MGQVSQSWRHVSPRRISVVATQKAVRVNFSIFSINATEVASILNGVCIWENRPLSSFVHCVD